MYGRTGCGKVSVHERTRRMITIELRDLEIHAFHGIYEGEDKTGSPYIVNLAATYDDQNIDFNTIDDTINYAELYKIVRNRMQIPTGLLERVCDSIIRHIKHQYPYIREIDLSIHKLQAPINDFQGKAGVRMNRKFNA
jgi:7,8-dihydroneopterin aldolase/epimerase/oxygenase